MVRELCVSGDAEFIVVLRGGLVVWFGGGGEKVVGQLKETHFGVGHAGDFLHVAVVEDGLHGFVDDAVTYGQNGLVGVLIIYIM